MSPRPSRKSPPPGGDGRCSTAKPFPALALALEDRIPVTRGSLTDERQIRDDACLTVAQVVGGRIAGLRGRR